MTENLSHYLEKGKTLHGDLCAGIVLGTRLSLVAMKALGMDPDCKNKNLIVFVETDRCIADAVQAITGCTLGHRTLKYMNYGKFSAAFYISQLNEQYALLSAEEYVIKLRETYLKHFTIYLMRS